MELGMKEQKQSPRGLLRLRRLLLVLLLVAAGAAAAISINVVRSGLSARDRPSWMEVTLASAMRRLAMPSRAKTARNPFTASPELLTEARRHFADHCASCHANDGSGNTEMGRNLYPRAPDLRLPSTQQLTDGEIYDVIHEGVRLTGMPAWGDPGKDDDSWKLVLFIRHLPAITPDEIKDMRNFNPKSPAEIQEEKEEQEFLNSPN
jgi:mono/diheme cytochrome c family protein